MQHTCPNTVCPSRKMIVSSANGLFVSFACITTESKVYIEGHLVWSDTMGL